MRALILKTHDPNVALTKTRLAHFGQDIASCTITEGKVVVEKEYVNKNAHFAKLFCAQNGWTLVTDVTPPAPYNAVLKVVGPIDTMPKVTSFFLAQVNPA